MGLLLALIISVSAESICLAEIEHFVEHEFSVDDVERYETKDSDHDHLRIEGYVNRKECCEHKDLECVDEPPQILQHVGAYDAEG